MFQFLIGSLTTELTHDERLYLFEFQFLIGSLTTYLAKRYPSSEIWFQFLIGSLTTFIPKSGRTDYNSRFNSL